MSERSGSGIALIAAGFVVSIVASLGLIVVYIAGGQPQVEGALIAASLGGLALGLIVWAHRLLPGGGVVEERVPHESPDDVRRTLETDIERGDIARRTFLARLLAGAAGALGLAALFPVASFGSGPGAALRRTAWTSGSRVVTQDGEVVTRDTLSTGGVLTVFPDGHVGRADSPALLVRVDADELNPLEGREAWTPDGYLAFSKICTHAGCPVGLYQAGSKELFCPCHQSVFDLSDGARPTAGPATRALPQLPLEIDSLGQLRAQGDFSAPVGPAFWDIDRGPDA